MMAPNTFKQYLIEARYYNNPTDFWKKLKQTTKQWVDVPTSYEEISKNPRLSKFMRYVIAHEDELEEIYSYLKNEFHHHSNQWGNPGLGNSTSEDQKWDRMYNNFNNYLLLTAHPNFAKLSRQKDWDEELFLDVIDQMMFAVAGD